MKEFYDVVVIGSGFGGSIIGCRSPRPGVRSASSSGGADGTTNNTDFPRSPSQVARNTFWTADSGRDGLVEYRAFRHVHVMQGYGVGGGSLHCFNVHLWPPARGPAGHDVGLWFSGGQSWVKGEDPCEGEQHQKPADDPTGLGHEATPVPYGACAHLLSRQPHVRIGGESRGLRPLLPMIGTERSGGRTE